MSADPENAQMLQVWGLVNLEKISAFLQRMKVDQKFRTYYYGLYDSWRLKSTGQASLITSLKKNMELWSKEIQGYLVRAGQSC